MEPDDWRYVLKKLEENRDIGKNIIYKGIQKLSATKRMAFVKF